MNNTKNITIGIITGGNSSERAISLMSAKKIQELLNIPTEYVFDYPTDTDTILKTKDSIDIFIPIIHGRGGEDGEVQRLLRSNGIPYIFSSPEAHEKAIDKRLTKNIVQEHGVRVAREFLMKDMFTVPVFVKPLSGGSSVHTAFISSQRELDEFLNDHPNIDFLIEEAIIGREFSVGIVRHNGSEIPLPVVEIKSKKVFFDYESKYDNDALAEEVCPADIPESLTKELQELALRVHTLLACKHCSRSDFIVTKDSLIVFLEINTIPGMTDRSLVPKEVHVAQLSLRDLYSEWIHSVL